MTGEKYNKYGYNPQQDENETQQQLQVQEQITLLVSAYDKKVAHQVFRNSLEWLEKYIEVVYPNYRIKKQIHDNNIKRQDANDPSRIKRLLSSSLYGFKTTLEVINGNEQSKQSLYEEIKKEYYEWLGVAGINPSNCPLELKNFLFEVNEILEGRGDKLEREVENRKWEIDPNSIEYEKSFSRLFANAQIPLENERNEYENLKGKTYKDIEIGNNFGGNSEPAKQTFKQMVGKHDYQGFSFMPQKDTQTIFKEQSVNDYQQRPSSVIIRNVKQEPQNWRKDEVITEYNNRGEGSKWESALIHVSAEVGFNGKVYNWQQPIYLLQRFNQAEIAEINQALSISQSSSSTSNYQQKYSKSDLTKVENTEKSNKDKNNKVGTIAAVSIFSALVIGGVILVARNKLKKVKKISS